MSTTCSGSIALTVAAVPTGMNAGVRTDPLRVCDNTCAGLSVRRKYLENRIQACHGRSLEVILPSQHFRQGFIKMNHAQFPHRQAIRRARTALISNRSVRAKADSSLLPGRTACRDRRSQLRNSRGAAARRFHPAAAQLAFGRTLSPRDQNGSLGETA